VHQICFSPELIIILFRADADVVMMRFFILLHDQMLIMQAYPDL